MRAIKSDRTVAPIKLVDKCDNIKVIDRRGNKKSYYDLCQGDLIEVKFLDESAKKGATLRGLFVRKAHGSVMSMQTALAPHAIMLDWIEQIRIITPHFDENDFI